jgi:hypothetical protein
MENVRAERGVRQEADDSSGASASGRRYPSVAVRTVTRIGHQSGSRSLVEPIDPAFVILSIGLAAELALPWAVIWLSDIFFFDIPAWSRWVVFGVPAALSVLATLIYWALRKRSKQPARAWDPRRQAY